MMDDLEQLLTNLHKLGSTTWITQYFDLAKKLLTNLGLENDDERLALTIDKDTRLPLNIGQRYVLLPLPGERVGCIVPASFSAEVVNGTEHGYFNPNTTRDAKWVVIDYPVGKRFPTVLYNACLETCEHLLNRTKKSGWRKHHKELMYNFIVEPTVRSEVISELGRSSPPAGSGPRKVEKNERDQNAYLLAWNPKKWDWSNLEQMVEMVRWDGKASMAWSCGHVQSIKPGDRVFLVRLGNVLDKGLMGSGVVTSRPYKDRHFSKPEAYANYVQVEFDVLINPEFDPILSLDLLKIGDLGKQQWTPQTSGISIRSDLLPGLEALWFSHLQEGMFRFNPLGEPEDQRSNDLFEGRSYAVTQTKYERNTEARRRCLSHYGHSCAVCHFNFEETFGELGKNFIHVHHLRQISEAGGHYKIDPVTDLRPVCPNCHAMLHRSDEPWNLEAIKRLLR